MTTQKTKWVTLDIETAPNIGYSWQGMFEVDIIKFVKEWYILSFAYKFEGKDVKVKALPDYETYKEDKTDDSELVRELWDILDMADVVCGHNLDRFDIRKINSRFLAHGLGLPSPYKTVDTLKVARKMFHLNSNKLTHIAKILGLGEKTETGGFDLWEDCMEGKRSAWKLMKEYNKHDVELTEAVYYALRPFITNHPNRNLTNGTTHNCPSCGGTHVTRRGFHRTKVAVYQKYQCQNPKCMSWSTGEKVNTDKVELK